MLLGAALRDADNIERPSAETRLLLHTPSPPGPLREVMTSLAKAIWPFERIEWMEELEAARLRQTPVSTLCHALKTKAGLENCDELWVQKLYETPDKIMMSAYPDAPVVLLEDGLTSYLPLGYCQGLHTVEWHYPRAAGGYLWRGIKRLSGGDRALKTYGMMPRHLERVAQTRLFLSRFLPTPPPLAPIPAKPIKTNSLLAAIDAAIAAIPELAFEQQPAPNAVALMGQFLWRHGGIRFKDELAIYTRAAKNLIDKGHTVYWKPHPRYGDQFHAEMVKTLGAESFRIIENAGHWPMEIVCRRMKFEAFVAASSSSLYYLNALYGVKIWNIAGLFPATGSVQREMKAMIAQTVPPLPLD